MELYPPNLVASMPDALDLLSELGRIGPGYHLQLRWEGLGVRNQGVVAGHGEGILQPSEDPISGVMDRGSLAMHDPTGFDGSASVRLTDGLMAQTDPQNGDERPQSLNELHADPGLPGGAGSGRYHDLFGVQVADSVDCDLVVADYPKISPQLAEELDQVPCERVVVVQHENHAEESDHGGSQTRAGDGSTDLG